MNPIALVLMISTMTLVTVITGYFFIRVLRTPPRPEPDSYADNDDEER